VGGNALDSIEKVQRGTLETEGLGHLTERLRHHAIELVRWEVDEAGRDFAQ
jgi:hypothetical protein